MKRSELVFSSILVPLDFLMLISAGLLAYLLRTSAWVAQYRPVLFYLNLPFEKYFGLIAGVAVFLLIIFSTIGLYNIRPSRPLLEDFFKILVGVSAGMIVLIFYTFLRREWFDSRFLILAGWLMAITLVFFGRSSANSFQSFLTKRGYLRGHRALVVGRDDISRKIIKNIKQEPRLGYQLVTNLVEPDIEEIRTKISNPGVDEVILADPDWPREKVLELVSFCEENHLIFKFVPNLFQTLTSNTALGTLGEVPLVELRRTALDGWGKIIKRVIDLLGACFGLVALSPFFLVFAFLIKWDSAGPVVVKLKRVSQNKEFGLYKFRSMVKEAESLKKLLWAYNERKDSPLFKMKDDPRVTKVGRFLRKYRIDELPQLANVLKGEISLVGPRPHQPDEIAKYQKHHKKVLAIKSGITGFAQVSGSSDLVFEEEIKLDTYYVEHWSLLMDLKIILKTFLIVFKDKAAC